MVQPAEPVRAQVVELANKGLVDVARRGLDRVPDIGTLAGRYVGLSVGTVPQLRTGRVLSRRTPESVLPNAARRLQYSNLAAFASLSGVARDRSIRILVQCVW